MLEHLNVVDSLAAGVRALPGTAQAFASTQAAWRFYHNERVCSAQLAAPLLEYARLALTEANSRYALIAHDWSHLDYTEHQSKPDRTRLHNKQVVGYELQTALLVKAQTGEPLSVVCQSLLAGDGLDTTRSAQVLPEISQLDELTQAVRYVDGCQLGKPCVHIADRECDSVRHYRLWHQERRLFRVRAKNHRVVKHGGQDQPLHKVVAELKQRGAFRYTQEVDDKGARAQQYVAETEVIIERPAKPQRTKHRTTGPRRLHGEAIALRLVVSQLKGQEGQILSEWWLWTNVPTGQEGVDAEAIARWYYWRWKIESFFKLLKSAGHNIEHWQQASAEAIAKRLLVATMSCVVVWQLARRTEPEAEEFRRFIIRLSGRQMKWGRAFTEPALLAGRGVFLAMLNVIEQYDVEGVQRMAELFLPRPYRVNRLSTCVDTNGLLG